MTQLDDETLRSLLRALPEASPRPGFTVAVLRRAAAAGDDARRFRLTLRTAVAVALVALVAGGVAWRGTVVVRERERRDRLRADHAQLARELADVRTLAADTPLVVVDVGGPRELVVDPALIEGPSTAAAASRAGLVPVTF